MKIDLTLNLQDAIVKKPKLRERYNHLFTLAHFGMHIDIHLNSQVPLDYIQSRDPIFDVRYVQDRDICLNDFNVQDIQPGDFVLFHTGMMERR